VVIEPRTLTLLDYGLNQQCAAGSGFYRLPMMCSPE
jgi:hypothetical protein